MRYKGVTVVVINIPAAPIKLFKSATVMFVCILLAMAVPHPKVKKIIAVIKIREHEPDPSGRGSLNVLFNHEKKFIILLM